MTSSSCHNGGWFCVAQHPCKHHRTTITPAPAPSPQHKPYSSTNPSTTKMSSETADFDPSGSKGLRVLCTHIAHKCVQAASVGGSASMPISFVWRKLIKKQPVDFVSLSRTAGRVHLAMLGLTGVAGAARVSQLDPEGVEDRGYRLYYNAHQGRTDIFATVGAGVGVVIASLALRGLKPPATPASYLGCLSLGVTGGVLAHVLTSRGQEE